MYRLRLLQSFLSSRTSVELSSGLFVGSQSAGAARSRRRHSLISACTKQTQKRGSRDPLQVYFLSVITPHLFRRSTRVSRQPSIRRTIQYFVFIICDLLLHRMKVQGNVPFVSRVRNSSQLLSHYWLDGSGIQKLKARKERERKAFLAL